MNREALLALGLSEEQVNQIMSMHGSATQNLRTQVTTLTTQLATATNPAQQPNQASVQQSAPTQQETQNEEMEQLRQQITQLQSENAKKDILAYATSKGLTGEQVANVLAAYGDNVDTAKASIDAICAIISEKETAAATAKEQEIARKAGNPGGGNGGTQKEQSTAEKLATQFFGTQKQENNILSHYVGGN